MKKLFDDIENVKRNEKVISVRWQRFSTRKKLEVNIFKDGDGCIEVEKYYISFEYNGIFIQDSYETDICCLGERVWKICDIIDSKGTDGLTAAGIQWSK